MKKALIPLLFGLCLGACGIAHAAEPAPKAQTVEGELVDLACYLDHGARGEKHKACATSCARNNLPIGLLDKRGHLYLVIDKAHKPMNATLADKMASTVKATGKVVSRNGVSMIEVSKLE